MAGDIPNNDTLRRDLLSQRYLLPDETEDQFYERIATFVTQGDMLPRKEEVLNLLKEGCIIFNSPLLMNAGAPAKTPLASACYVLPVEDDINSIMKLQNLSAKIFKLGAGVGVDYSKLRKEGAIVGSGGTASGPVSFMTLIDQLAEVIKSGGKRRAAIMSSLRVDHEDILKFIKCKRNDDFLLNTNISVMMTDNFMEKVVNNTLNEAEKNIWEELVYNAWLRGDPGIVFIDTINDQTNGVIGTPYTAVNACVTGDTMLLTDKGNKPIQSLVGNQVTIWNGHEWSEVTPAVTGHNKKVLKITLSTGDTLTCTEYHTLYKHTSYRRVIKISASEAKIGDKLIKLNLPIIQGTIHNGHHVCDHNMYTNGFFSGDGYYLENKPCVAVYATDKIPCAEHTTYKNKREEPCGRYVYTYDKSELHTKYFVPSTDHSISNRLDWLAGLIDSDGCINDTEGGIAISSINYQFILKVKELIMSLGCVATLAVAHTEQEHLLPNGKGSKSLYECKELYRLTIPSFYVKQLFQLGLKTYRVQCKVKDFPRKITRYPTIVNIEDAGIADTVYCVNEPKRHMAVFNNILTGNCSEFSLLPYESCLIGSINVRKVNTYKQLKEVSNLMVRCLDNVIDYAWYPSEEIKQAAYYYRRVGVGITGLSEYLIDRSIRYGSQAAIDATKALLMGLDNGAYEATTQLAIEKGPCPAIADGKFLLDIRREDTNNTSALRRNITTTTVAPTGSTSILLGVDGTGCEPLFSFVFSRVVKYAEDKWYTISTKVLQDVFEKYKIEITPDRLEEIKKNNGSVQGLPWVPEHIQSFMVTAQDLTPMDHVRMLAAVQQYVEANISKTINLPNNATTSDVAEVYIEAWKRDCKCVTVFRDGCKSTQVLVATNNAKDSVQIIKNKDIPTMLDAKRIKISTPSGSMYVMLSFLNGKPIEVFANLGKSGGDDYAYTEALGRVMSLALKYGVPSSKIIQTLRGIKGKDVALFNDEYIYSVPDAIAAAIHYILEENHLTPSLDSGIINHPCPQCGVELVQDNGCGYCKSCGWSNCS